MRYVFDDISNLNKLTVEFNKSAKVICFYISDSEGRMLIDLNKENADELCKVIKKLSKDAKYE